MSAATGPGGAHRELHRDPGRAERLVVWVDGDPGAEGVEIVVDERWPGRFSLADCVAETWRENPDAVLGAIYRGRGMASGGATLERGSWQDLSACAAGVDLAGEQRAYTGDTTPTSLRALRQWMSSQLRGTGFPVDDIVLVTSELSTNVERHAPGWVTVDLIERGDTVVVSVTDPVVTELPRPRDAGPDEVSGRGLLVVASLAEVWGVVIRPTSKSVWAAFGTRPRS